MSRHCTKGPESAQSDREQDLQQELCLQMFRRQRCHAGIRLLLWGVSPSCWQVRIRVMACVVEIEHN